LNSSSHISLSFYAFCRIYVFDKARGEIVRTIDNPTLIDALMSCGLHVPNPWTQQNNARFLLVGQSTQLQPIAAYLLTSPDHQHHQQKPKRCFTISVDDHNPRKGIIISALAFAKDRLWIFLIVARNL
jgi:hypothetical protein